MTRPVLAPSSFEESFVGRGFSRDLNNSTKRRTARGAVSASFSPFSSHSPLATRHFFFVLLLASFATPATRAQEKPILQIEHDCQVFAVSNGNKIVCAVPQLKRIKKDIIQRADIYVASPNGKDRQIVEGEKFMPVPPLQSFVVQSLSWSPDGSRLAMSMTTEKLATDYEQSSSAKAIALLEDDGREIKIPGLKTRFFEDAGNATWLTDNSTVAYLLGAGPFKIGRVSTVTGQSTTLFGDHTFDAVVWDAAHNQAYALSQNLNPQNRLAIFQLDLLKEGIREISRIDAYASGLSLSPSGKTIAFFSDGDAIEVIEVASAAKPVKVRAGSGVFAWSRDERRVLLKRGPPEKSGELIWVGLYEDSFVPALSGLEYHSFAITPDGSAIVVTQPGRGVLRMFSIQ